MKRIGLGGWTEPIKLKCAQIIVKLIPAASIKSIKTSPAKVIVDKGEAKTTVLRKKGCHSKDTRVLRKASISIQ